MDTFLPVSLFWLGFRKSLDYDDLCDLNHKDKSCVIAPKLQQEWDEQLRKAGLVKIIILILGCYFSLED